MPNARCPEIILLTPLPPPTLAPITKHNDPCPPAGRTPQSRPVTPSSGVLLYCAITSKSIPFMMASHRTIALDQFTNAQPDFTCSTISCLFICALECVFKVRPVPSLVAAQRMRMSCLHHVRDTSKQRSHTATFHRVYAWISCRVVTRSRAINGSFRGRVLDLDHVAEECFLIELERERKREDKFLFFEH